MINRFLKNMLRFIPFMGFCIIGFLGCHRVFYNASNEKKFDPNRFPHAYQEHWIPSSYEKDVLLHALYFFSGTKIAKGIIFFFHGNSHNVSFYFPYLYFLLDYGWDIFLFDYRGFGKSLGSATPQNTIQDGMDAFKYIQADYPKTPLVVFGNSLGGIIALKTIAELKDPPYWWNNIKMMVLDSTFSSYKAMGVEYLQKKYYGFLKHLLPHLLLSDIWAFNGSNDSLPDVPKILLHGTQDTVVSLEHGLGLYDVLAAPKSLWIIPGGKHCDAFKRPEYRFKLIHALDQL